MSLPYLNNTNANSLIYSSSVASWLSQIIGWDPGFGLAQDPGFYEKLLSDSAVSSALDKLQKLVVGHDFFHQPKGETREDWLLAKCLDELQQETEGFSQSLYNMAAASWKGATWCELRTQRRILRIGDGKPRVWTVIVEAKDTDKRRFRLTRAAASPLTREKDGRPYQGALSSRWRWEFNRGFAPDAGTSSYYVPIEQVAPPSHWCLHRVDTSERGLGYGYGLAEDLYFGIYAKAAVLRNLLQGIERWGQGFLVQAVAGLRMGGPGGMTPEQKINAVVTTLRRYRSQNVYAIDKDDDLKLMDGPAESVTACMGVISYFDDCHTMRILHAKRTSGGGSDGAFAQGKIEETSEDANVSYLRGPLEERWTLTGTRLLVRANKHNFADMGIPDFLSTPRLRLRGRKTADPEKAAVAIETAQKIGLPLLKREVYDLLEFTPPKPWDGPDEILTPPQLAQALEQRPEVAGKLGEARERVAAQNGERKPAGTGGDSVAHDEGEARTLRALAETRG